MRGADHQSGDRAHPSYRNVGARPSWHLVVISPASFEKFLEPLSAFPPVPPDMAALMGLAGDYGPPFL